MLTTDTIINNPEVPHLSDAIPHYWHKSPGRQPHSSASNLTGSERRIIVDLVTNISSYYFVSIVGPAPKLHVALLVVKREPSDVNFASRLEYSGWDVGTAPVTLDHHIGRKCSIKSFISTERNCYWLFLNLNLNFTYCTLVSLASKYILVEFWCRTGRRTQICSKSNYYQSIPESYKVNSMDLLDCLSDKRKK